MSEPDSTTTTFQSRKAARVAWPWWLRLFMPVLITSAILTVALGIVTLLLWVHRFVYPGATVATLSDTAGSLIFLPSLLGAVAPGLMLSNLLLRAIPPIQSIFASHSGGVSDAAYKRAQRDLLKMTLWISVLSLSLALFGAVFLA